MSTMQYYRLALLQYILYQQNLQQYSKLTVEVQELRSRVALHQKKYRRCDRQIEKDQQCGYCEKKYASEVALKLHLKLKHAGHQYGSEEGERDESEGYNNSVLGDKQNRRMN